MSTYLYARSASARRSSGLRWRQRQPENEGGKQRRQNGTHRWTSKGNSNLTYVTCVILLASPLETSLFCGTHGLACWILHKYLKSDIDCIRQEEEEDDGDEDVGEEDPCIAPYGGSRGSRGEGGGRGSGGEGAAARVVLTISS